MPAAGLQPVHRRSARTNALIDELLARGLTALTAIPGGVRARFIARPKLKADLDPLMALEARCCPFLSLIITGADDAAGLEVTGPPEAQTLIAELFGDRAATLPDR